MAGIDRLGKVLSVTAGPSATENGVALVTALGRLSAGGTVLLGEGPYTLTQPLSLSQGVRVCGVGTVGPITGSSPSLGTWLLIDYGFAGGVPVVAPSAAAIVMNTGTAIEGVGFFYPRQKSQLVEVPPGTPFATGVPTPPVPPPIPSMLQTWDAPYSYGPTLQVAPDASDVRIKNCFFQNSVVAIDSRQALDSAGAALTTGSFNSLIALCRGGGGRSGCDEQADIRAIHGFRSRDPVRNIWKAGA